MIGLLRRCASLSNIVGILWHWLHIAVVMWWCERFRRFLLSVVASVPRSVEYAPLHDITLRGFMRIYENDVEAEKKEKRHVVSQMKNMGCIHAGNEVSEALRRSSKRSGGLRDPGARGRVR